MDSRIGKNCDCQVRVHGFKFMYDIIYFVHSYKEYSVGNCITLIDWAQYQLGCDYHLSISFSFLTFFRPSPCYTNKRHSLSDWPHWKTRKCKYGLHWNYFRLWILGGGISRKRIEFKKFLWFLMLLL